MIQGFLRNHSRMIAVWTFPSFVFTPCVLQPLPTSMPAQKSPKTQTILFVKKKKSSSELCRVRLYLHGFGYQMLPYRAYVTVVAQFCWDPPGWRSLLQHGIVRRTFPKRPVFLHVMPKNNVIPQKCLSRMINIDRGEQFGNGMIFLPHILQQTFTTFIFITRQE